MQPTHPTMKSLGILSLEEKLAIIVTDPPEFPFYFYSQANAPGQVLHRMQIFHCQH